MIAIVDYGVGNLFSLSSSLKALGLEAEITADAARLRRENAGEMYGSSFRRYMPEIVTYLVPSPIDPAFGTGPMKG